MIKNKEEWDKENRDKYQQLVAEKNTIVKENTTNSLKLSTDHKEKMKVLQKEQHIEAVRV